MSRKKKKGIMVIEGGLLTDGTGNKPIENSTIVVEGKRIKTVAKAGQVEAMKANGITIDASGKTVMPGLIDSHLHLIGMKTDRLLEEQLIRPPQLGLIKSVFDAVALLEAGFTTVKDCGGFGIYLKKAIAEGTIRGPRILSAGYVLVKQQVTEMSILFLWNGWMPVFRREVCP